jgi:hypothetical protein
MSLLKSECLIANLCLVLAVSMISGCGGGDYDGAKRMAIDGSVTVNGQPVQEGTLNLIPASGSTGRKAAAGIENGSYSIAEKDGPNIGKYNVQIYAYQPVGGAAPVDEDTAEGAGVPTQQILPPQFNEQTSLEVEIVDDKTTYDFNLTP